jgi:hypothetical protein
LGKRLLLLGYTCLIDVEPGSQQFDRGTVPLSLLLGAYVHRFHFILSWGVNCTPSCHRKTSRTAMTTFPLYDTSHSPASGERGPILVERVQEPFEGSALVVRTFVVILEPRLKETDRRLIQFNLPPSFFLCLFHPIRGINLPP